MIKIFSKMNYLRHLQKVPQRPVLKLAVRTMYNPMRFDATEEKWRVTDGVSKTWKLIYKAPMNVWLNITAGYLTTSAVFTAGAAAYYAAFIFDPLKLNDPVILGDDVIIANSPLELSCYVAVFLGLHIAVKVVLSKYVLRIYQQEDKYIAIFRGHLFNSIMKHEFHLNDFTKLKPTIVVSWGDARFGLGGKQGIILESYFKTPAHFNYLLYKRKPENKNDED